MEGFRSIFRGVDDLPREQRQEARLDRHAGDAVGLVVMQVVRPVREGQMGISEPILGAQERPAEPICQ